MMNKNNQIQKTKKILKNKKQSRINNKTHDRKEGDISISKISKLEKANVETEKLNRLFLKYLNGYHRTKRSNLSYLPNPSARAGYDTRSIF